MNTSCIKNTQVILDNLKNFRGTGRYYRHSPFLFPYFHLTDGTEYLAEECEAFWLFDFIASHQATPKILSHPKLQEIQFWSLKVKDSSAVIACSWDSNEVVFKEKIPYTDFPLDEVRIWVAPLYLGPDDIEPPKKWVAYLPGEH